MIKINFGKIIKIYNSNNEINPIVNNNKDEFLEMYYHYINK